MRRTRLLCAMAVICCSAVAVTAGQAKFSGPLPENLRAPVRDGQFGVVTSIRGLPLGVRDALERVFAGRGLDIAEPGAEFQGESKAGGSLPARRLIAAGCTSDRCLVYYERAGSPRSWRVALFHWRPEETRFEWGATATSGLKTIDDVRKFVLSGTAKGDTTAW